MNEIARAERFTRTTNAAEGLPRWRWTTAELVRLTELGAFRAEDRFELIGGEIVPMSPTGIRHEVVSSDLEQMLRARASAHPEIRICTERQFNLSDDTYTKPDILVGPANARPPFWRGPDVALVIEVASSSLGYDLEAKAMIYARHGVREYWVIDAATLLTTVHNEPSADGYRVKTESRGDEMLTPHLAPVLTVRLADLDLG